MNPTRSIDEEPLEQPDPSLATPPTEIRFEPIALVGKPRFFPGHVFGFHQSTLRLQVRISLPASPSLVELNSLLAAQGCETVGALDQEPEMAILRRLAGWTFAMQKAAGLPVFETGRVSRSSAQAPDTYGVILPCFEPAPCLHAVKVIIRLLNQALGPTVYPADRQPQDTREELGAAALRLAASAPRGFNSIHFLRAAFDLGMSWTRVVDNVFQVGWGARSRWLVSSLTDRTPSISAHLARDKTLTASVLRAAGLPVPAHFTARTPDEAAAMAAKLGYPVVVKPVDLDGGIGVAAHLTTEAAVRKAFESARQLSERILVERHVQGRDYRMQVVQGEVLGVLVREPGGVTGDGVRSVRDLVEAQNSERKLATDDRRFLKPVNFDDEAVAMLEARSMTGESVPVAGEFIRLRGAANVASGGVPIPVPLEIVHPDNFELAVRAVRALRLDLAGVDLLTPDISRSWREAGAAICEVNAQPQMFSTMHKPTLSRLMGGQDGRIPTIVLMGDDEGRTLGQHIRKALSDRRLVVGWATGDELWMGSRRIDGEGRGVFEGARALLRDSAVQALLLSIEDDRILDHGWPIDRCDVLVLAGTRIAARPGRLAAQALTDVVDLALGLRPGRVIVDARAPECLSIAQGAVEPPSNCVVIGRQDANTTTVHAEMTAATLAGLAHTAR